MNLVLEIIGFFTAFQLLSIRLVQASVSLFLNLMGVVDDQMRIPLIIMLSSIRENHGSRLKIFSDSAGILLEI